MSKILIYWPNDIKVSNDGKKYIILGYKIDRLTYVVIEIVSQGHYRPSEIDKGVTKQIEIVGCINFKNKKLTQQIENYDFNMHKPIVSKNHSLIYFKPPKSWKLEYFSLEPVAINIFWNDGDTGEMEERDKYIKIKNKYQSKLMHHFSNQLDSPRTTMKDVLRIINLTNYLRSKIHYKESKSSIMDKWGINGYYCGILTTAIGFLYSFIIQSVCLLLNHGLSNPFINIKYSSYNSYLKNERAVSLTSVSYFIHQINVRTKQLYYLPWLFRKLKLSKEESEVSIIKEAKFSPSEYIKFYNTVWIMVNDILLGNILYGILIDHKIAICGCAQKMFPMYEKWIESVVTWLMNSPAGFKLNNELASFFGQLIFWVLQFWKNTTLKWLSDYFDKIFIFCVYVARYGGLSLVIALVLDIGGLLFLNLQGFYIACTRLYHWQLTIISSLFRLFYGKKYNILRNRVDSNDYEFDQLMLGIIIFSILIYLLPTVFAFYLTFVITRLLTLYGTMVFKFALIIINHFPIVVILLKFKNDERLPSGIFFERCKGYVVLKSKPITLKQIYYSHINSMYDFNLFNMNNCQLHTLNTRKLYEINDVIENWNRAAFFNVVKNILIGKPIAECDYKQMF